MFVKEVLDRYPWARKLHIVLDNLNTHFAGSFEKTFGEEQAKSILQRIEFLYLFTSVESAQFFSQDFVHLHKHALVLQSPR